MDALRTLLNEKLSERESGPRFLVEFTSRTFGAMGGTVLEVGTHRREVTEAGFRELEANVEHDEAKVRQAREHFERHRDEVLEQRKNELPFNPSLEASFRLLFGRDIKPLDSVRRVVEDKPKKS
jgi:hypothetical protein